MHVERGGLDKTVHEQSLAPFVEATSQDSARVVVVDLDSAPSSSGWVAPGYRTIVVDTPLALPDTLQC